MLGICSKLFEIESVPTWFHLTSQYAHFTTRSNARSNHLKRIEFQALKQLHTFHTPYARLEVPTLSVTECPID